MVRVRFSAASSCQTTTCSSTPADSVLVIRPAICQPRVTVARLLGTRFIHVGSATAALDQALKWIKLGK
jgi:hypothetical protein